MRWDIFCRVIDNFGDVGVVWRLARDLATRGNSVRLWLDDATALAWMAPVGAAGVEVRHWTASVALPAPGEVVVEMFGCEPPALFVEAMALSARPPVWINREYLSAEPYVERSHGLPSPPQSGPGRGLRKWFFYPGFTRRTGGLLREPGLLAERAAFDHHAWLIAHGITPAPGERRVSLFCYDNPALPALLAALAATPTLLLLAPGAAQRQLQNHRLPPGLRCHALPWLAQPDYDRLLWACDLNFVRGEDSAVRAMWAGTPFVWQVYPQQDGAHAAKLDAFIGCLRAVTASAATATATATDYAAIGAWLRGWNGLQPLPAMLPAAAPWHNVSAAWREHLAEQADLTQQLLDFVGNQQSPGC